MSELDHKMLITKRSEVSGKIRIMDLDVTEEQLERWYNGGLIQDVFPHLNDAEREFLLTGITDEEWNEIFGEE